MSSTLTLLYQIGIMIIILLVGILCSKRKIITEQGSVDLSNLLLLVVNPLLIFISYQQDYDAERLQGLLFTILVSAVGMTMMVLLSYLLIPKKNNKNYLIERFCAAYPNCGFIGIPIIGGVFGAEGVFYLTGIMTVFNLFIWTHGLIMMKGNEDAKLSMKEILRNVLVNPMVIAILLGFLMYVLQIRLPAMLLESFQYLANMNTALAMLIAGTILARTNIKKVLTNRRVYYVSFLKLVLFPLLLLLLFSWLPLDFMIIMTIVIGLGCSTAATCTAFAIRFERDSVYASEIFATTTVFAALSLPLVMLAGNLLENIIR